MTFRQILLASAAVGALVPATPALSGDDLMVAQHYKDFTDRRVVSSAARAFVKEFTNLAILAVMEDPQLTPVLSGLKGAYLDQPITDAARTFTELLQKPQKASDPIIYTHLNPISPEGVVTTFAARAPNDVLASSSTGFEWGGQIVAFRYCIEAKGQVVSYGGVGYDGLPVAPTSGSSIPRKVGKPMIDPTTGAVVVDAATGQPRTSFAFACKAVLAQPIREYTASRLGR